MQNKLRLGIQAAKAGKKAQAKALLLEVVEADETQLQAWLWLSYIIDDLDEKEICFSNILALDPNNEFAQKGQTWLALKKSLRETPPATIEKSKKPTSNIASPPTPTAGLPPEDEFDNENLCVYCTALTTENDETCPKCQNQLVIKTRVSPERSVWLWRAFFVQVYTIFYLLSFSISYFAFFTTIKNVPNLFAYWPLYFGLDGNQPDKWTKTVLTIMPVWVFWLLIFVSIYAAVLMFLLIYRVPHTHWLYLLNAGLMLIIGLIGLILPSSGWMKFGGFLGIVLGIGQVIITTNMWKDFTIIESRLRLKVDADAKNSTALYLSAREYGRKGLWGQAVIHLRRAVAKNPANQSYQLALVVAYLNIQRYDLAEENLQIAESMDPNAAEVKALRNKLDLNRQ